MRLASFNVENLFDRAKALNGDTWAEGKPVLERFAKLNQLLGELNYTPARKQTMVGLMKGLGLENSDTGEYVLLRQNRGALVKRPRSGGLEIVAEGRADWAGTLELRDEPVDEVAMRNTARVMTEVGADILAVVEAESRPVLSAFNQQIVSSVGGDPFSYVMVIDGNDERGIDVGALSRSSCSIGLMRSHVDDVGQDGKPIFSRDCPEFELVVNGKSLWVLVNHFKSKGYGTPTSSNARRKAQAQRVKEIYEGLRARGEDRIAIVGDLNDTPDSDPLAPLLKRTDLQDISQHDTFDDGGYPGTYGSCGPSNKIDYILLSPALFAKVTAGGVLRKGMWPGVRPKKWDVFDELKTEHQAASDHAALWADIDL
ncbi:MAG: endonuclease/exonuclease/phosphatase family protein [Burkholderiales bacterium]|nr:endonuclease/exonuclease/phosphatase family protein [Burkholderiales bacterium]